MVVQTVAEVVGQDKSMLERAKPAWDAEQWAPLGSAWGTWAWLAVILLLVLLASRLVGAAMTSWVGASPAAATSAEYAVLVGVGIPAAVLTRGWLLRRGWAARRAMALKLRMCPACLYDLGATKAGAEGLTECPECGAAWRRGDEGTSEK